MKIRNNVLLEVVKDIMICDLDLGKRNSLPFFLVERIVTYEKMFYYVKKEGVYQIW